MKFTGICLLLFTLIASAQDSGVIREHMKVIRDRRTTLAGKVPAMEALLDLGLEGSRQLARSLGEVLSDANSDFDRDAGKFLQRFEAAAIRTGENRGDRGHPAEVKALRETILRNARDQNLTKEQVVEESDPALKELTELFHVSLDHVYAQDKRLTDGFFALLSQLETNQRLFEYYERARAEVAKSEDAKRLLKQLEDLQSPAEEEALLVEEQQRIVLRAIPMGESDRRVLLENEALTKEIDAKEADGILELNLIRIRCGIGALRIDKKLCEAGRGHSQDMVELEFFAHESPVDGKKTLGDRASKAGTSASSENIARGQRTGKAVIDGWWHSPGHHRNMLAAATRTGIGRFEFHWTQLFG